MTADAMVAEEREACAKIADAEKSGWDDDIGENIETAIRARSNPVNVPVPYKPPEP